mmetsp:Transcript_52505/g.111551  ORF Transcript_52505/g.111551 Transcript_52505/m.111551 type:complete len:166 (+) Transcript_52505:988-1485(+)|eukprot:CAMPEP_0172545170 /NCGR_PEP_ID=MMETSP1067-20121228/15158_1 /TAXON_ID=265564 ORGANISM="Thalassiosira punctigera, Strain Tpunct2005C2" /NCGR_SAMPLE_ID=MMETSP1067 /ASSEMBLY_ACC=CAM_ASM_000444 /LENGTH=165 /DNA_ID=CAMNT_0013331867 /DNA_START=973 /DNA_END=1470 /DNA_ORIENTATION=+
MRQNTIIEHTVSRIALNNQLEVFLKVKQATNTDFSFLHSSNELHRYYLYLKEKNSNNGEHDGGPAKEEGGDDSSIESKNPLSGLLGDYASSDEEGMSPTENNTVTSYESKSKIEENRLQDEDEGEGIQVEPSEAESTRKAERLERLRVWKESRLKQSDQHGNNGN